MEIVQVDDNIRRSPRRPLRREPLRLASVTSEAGHTIGNGADGISDIEGKATRVGASERGQRTSFNRTEGISDIEHVAIGNRAGRRQRS
jgi:hypothetical protein